MLHVSCYTCHVTRVQEAVLLRARGAAPARGGQGEAGAEGHYREYHHSLLHSLFVWSKYTASVYTDHTVFTHICITISAADDYSAKLYTAPTTYRGLTWG